MAANEWIPIEGMWMAHALNGRGHVEGPHRCRRYRALVPCADLGAHLYQGGQARFMEVAGGDERIYGLPTSLDEARVLQFFLDIDDNAVGGQLIAVKGLEVRAPRERGIGS